MSEQQRIARAFGAAAAHYDEHAPLQRLCGLRLIDYLESHRITVGMDAMPHRIVDLGCGTGNLTLALAERYPKAELLAIDLAEPMLAATTRRFTEAGRSDRLQVACRDAATVALPPSVDLLVSNLCAQWFSDVTAALHHHAAQSRVLVWSMLLDGSFASWRMLHEAHGYEAGIRELPTARRLRETLGAYPSRRSALMIERRHVIYPSALAFVRGLRGIGATTPQRPNATPWRLLRRASTPLCIEYVIGYLIMGVDESMSHINR